MNLLDGTTQFHQLADEPIAQWYSTGPMDPMTEDGFNELRAKRIRLLREEFNEYLGKGEDKDNPVEILDGLLDVIVIAWGTGLAYFGKELMEAAAAEVVRSNLSKVDGTLGPIVRRESDGKVLKPEGWRAPQIGRVLEEAMLNGE